MMRKGFTLAEMLVVIALTVVVAGTSTLILFRRQGSTQLSSAGSVIVAEIRAAQQNAVTDASSTDWGIRFDNASSTMQRVVTYSSSTFVTSTFVSEYRLPSRVEFYPTSIASGTVRDVVFARRTGFPTASSTVTLRTTNSAAYFRLDISTAGIVSSSMSTTTP